MILHYSPRSPFVRKVLIAALETGLDARLEKVRSVTNMLVPNRALMQLNPWSKIPTLIKDDGEVLIDSDVICEYLDSLHAGAKLFPAEPARRWIALRRCAFGNEMLNALILWRNERERPEERQLALLIDAFKLKLETGLASLEREAAALAAAPLDIGHIGIACALGYIDQRFAQVEWRRAHRELAVWHATFSQRASYQQTLPVDDVARVTAVDLLQNGSGRSVA